MAWSMWTQWKICQIKVTNTYNVDEVTLCSTTKCSEPKKDLLQLILRCLHATKHMLWRQHVVQWLCQAGKIKMWSPNSQCDTGCQPSQSTKWVVAMDPFINRIQCVSCIGNSTESQYVCVRVWVMYVTQYFCKSLAIISMYCQSVCWYTCKTEDCTWPVWASFHHKSGVSALQT